MGQSFMVLSHLRQKDATKFYDCHLKISHTMDKSPYGNFLVESNDIKRMSFTNCTFISNIKKLCWFSSSAVPTEEKYQFINCSFTINNTNLPEGDFVAQARGMALKNCTFTFTDPDAKKKRYTLASNMLKPVNGDANGTKIFYKIIKLIYLKKIPLQANILSIQTQKLFRHILQKCVSIF